MLERFTDRARQALIEAKTRAAERGDAQVGGLHMLSALTTGDSVATRVLTSLGVTAAGLDRELGPAGGAVLPEDSADADALRSIGIDIDEIKRKIEESFGSGALQRIPQVPRGPLNWLSPFPVTDEARLALAEAFRETRALHHSYIGPEHLLLGLLRAAGSYPHGNLTHALIALRLDYPTTRRHVLDELTRASAERS